MTVDWVGYNQIIENDLAAFIDYIVSHAIKKFNYNSSVYMVLVNGGKAYSSYIETPYRQNSTDWDVTLISSNADVTPSDITKITDTISEHMTQLYEKMPTAILSLHNVITKLMKFNDRVKLRDLDVSIKFKTGLRLSADKKVTVHFINLVYGNKSLFPMLEVVYKPVEIGEFERYQKLKNCRFLYSETLIDQKRSYLPLKDVEDDMKELIKPGSTYLKPWKAKERLQNIAIARTQKHIVCHTVGDNDGECLDRIIYDATNSLYWFIETITIDEDYKQQSYSRASNKLYKYIYDYTLDYSVNKTLLLNYYFQDNLEDERIRNMDACFDEWNKNIVNFHKPLILYRLTRYIDPPRQGRYDVLAKSSLYDFAVGDVIPNILYTSTSWTNKMNAEAFNDESQFKGCLFIITAKNSKGIITIGKKSYFPTENEVLLDRRGYLKITKVEYKYISEKCGGEIILAERLVLHCDYLGYDIPEDSKINESIILSEKEFLIKTSVKDKIADKLGDTVSSRFYQYRNEWLGIQSINEGNSVFRYGGLVDTVNLIRAILNPFYNYQDLENNILIIDRWNHRQYLPDFYKQDIINLKIPYEIIRRVNKASNAGLSSLFLVGAGIGIGINIRKILYVVIGMILFTIFLHSKTLSDFIGSLDVNYFHPIIVPDKHTILK